MKLSVVIVSYNTSEETLRCLESLIREAPDGTQVVVVDNGSADGTADSIRARFPQVVVDEAGENLGFARGVNRGVAQAAGQQILLLNPDTLVLPGSMQALSEFADAHPAYGLYGGRTLRPLGGVDPSSCWGAPSLWSLVCFALGLTTAFRRSRWFDPESLGKWERDSVRVVPIVTGCLLLMTRESWNSIGGMDETFFLYGEDAEFSIRATRAGLRPVIVPAAEIVHAVGGSTATSGASSGVKMTMVMAGKATLLRKVWSPVRAAVGLRLLLTGVAVRGGLERALRRPGTWCTVWARRRDWFEGYPAARRTLFGLSEH